MKNSRLLFASVFALLILVAVVAGTTAAGFVSVLNPESVKSPSLVPPLLAPPGEGYVTQKTDSSITAPDHRPVAQFADLPRELSESLAVNFPASQTAIGENTIAYTVLSSVRYSGNGHTVVVTTARPSVRAANEPSVFGNQTITLRNGENTWATTGIPGKTPNQLVFVRQGLIVTLASDLPLNTLSDLAMKIVIKTK